MAGEVTAAFEQYLAETINQGKRVNTLFEKQLFELAGILENISSVLTSSNIDHEVIGGLAVAIHVEEVNPERTALTRDVDILVNRVDLDRIKGAAAQQGFRFRHTASLDMLMFGQNDSAREAVHLLFSGERVRPTDVIAAPRINPVQKSMYGKAAMVIRLDDLLRMKLNSFRLKDQVHIQTLDVCGLITPAIEASLEPGLRNRLQQVRAAE